jgi:hypothetical protein
MWSTLGLRQPEAAPARCHPIKKPRFIPAQPQWVSSPPELSAALNAPVDGLGPLPPVRILHKKLILATTQAGTSGKLQSKRITGLQGLATTRVSKTRIFVSPKTLLEIFRKIP